MPSRSSNSVRHDAVPRDAVLQAARSWAADLRRRRPELVRVGLFGSYVTDTYGPGSDLDVLIEVTHSSFTRRADRAADYLPEAFPVGVDLFVCTSAELAQPRAEGSGWLAAIDRNVVWLE